MAQVAKPLPVMYEMLWQSGEVPIHWKRGNISLIFKKWKTEDPGNYESDSLNSETQQDNGAVLPGNYIEAHVK